jgi:restriction system protein
LAAMWMVRGDAGRLYEDFREKSAVGIGWADLGQYAKKGMPRSELKSVYGSWYPNAKPGAVVSAASQVWRFINEVAPGDFVATYSPADRTYLLGTIKSESIYKDEWKDLDMALARSVEWQGEVSRDALTQQTRNSLGSTLTVFQIPSAAEEELWSAAKGKPVSAESRLLADEDAIDPFADIEAIARERIKDLVNGLDWSDMQELVAGILRAMGYKTQISPAGSDRGKDIVASPDGFGFEQPRIVVEVKHRKEQMGADALRSFIGGRHKDDRGLYVSTGGFSTQAKYEADRSQIPVTLWTLDNLVRALLEHYSHADAETKRLVPLKHTYWPA